MHYSTNMETKIINKKLLRIWEIEYGRNARKDLEEKAFISKSLVGKLFADYYVTVPNPNSRKRICLFLGVTEDELFPTVKITENAA